MNSTAQYKIAILALQGLRLEIAKAIENKLDRTTRLNVLNSGIELDIEKLKSVFANKIDIICDKQIKKLARKIKNR